MCLTALTTPEFTEKGGLVKFYYDGFKEGFKDIRMSPLLMLALHRMGLMHEAKQYRFTLADITDECVAWYSELRALKQCLALGLIAEVPITSGYDYDYVRSLME